MIPALDSAIRKVLEETETIKASGSILAVCRNEQDGRSKNFTSWVRYVRGAGIEEGENLPPHDLTYLAPDAGEVAVLAWENIAPLIARDSGFDFGRCGENLFVTSGNFSRLQPGDLLYVGMALLVVTQVGKNCDRTCGLFNGTDEACPLATSWIFANVLKGGRVCVDDPVIVTPALPE